MKKTIVKEICPLCKKELSAKRHGFVFLLGYSRGGWGSRETDIKIDDEVCCECWDSIFPIAEHLRLAIEARKNKKQILKFQETKILKQNIKNLEQITDNIIQKLIKPSP